MNRRLALLHAVNDYARACGGRPHEDMDSNEARRKAWSEIVAIMIVGDPHEEDLKEALLRIDGLTEHLIAAYVEKGGIYAELGVPNRMDLPSGPVCWCGLPSALQDGECGKHQDEDYLAKHQQTGRVSEAVLK